MNGHTPGPWQVSEPLYESRVGHHYVVETTDAKGQYTKIALVCDNLKYDPPDADEPVTNPDNARLIAAAPALLETCRQMSSLFKRGIVVPATPQSAEFVSACLDELRAAIASTEGGDA